MLCKNNVDIFLLGREISEPSTSHSALPRMCSSSTESGCVRARKVGKGRKGGRKATECNNPMSDLSQTRESTAPVAVKI